MGIRRLLDLNSAAGLKLFWRYFTTEGVWASWMKKNYNITGPRTVSAHPMASGTWRFLLAQKNLAALHINSGTITDSIDTWIWKPSSTGQFSFSSACNVSREHGQGFGFTKVVWCKANCPKIACYFLKALTSRLLTKHRLMNFGIITDDTCVLCNSSPETTDQLFFSCEFSTLIWSRCKLKLGLLPVIHPLQVEASEFQKNLYTQDKIISIGPSYALNYSMASMEGKEQ